MGAHKKYIIPFPPRTIIYSYHTAMTIMTPQQPQRKSFQNPRSPKATTTTGRAFLKTNTLRFAISAATIIASLNILLIPSSFFQLRDCNEKDGWSLLPLKLGSPSLSSNRGALSLLVYATYINVTFLYTVRVSCV